MKKKKKKLRRKKPTPTSTGCPSHSTGTNLLLPDSPAQQSPANRSCCTNKSGFAWQQPPLGSCQQRERQGSLAPQHRPTAGTAQPTAPARAGRRAQPGSDVPVIAPWPCPLSGAIFRVFCKHSSVPRLWGLGGSGYLEVSTCVTSEAQFRGFIPPDPREHSLTALGSGGLFQGGSVSPQSCRTSRGAAGPGPGWTGLGAISSRGSCSTPSVGRHKMSFKVPSNSTVPAEAMGSVFALAEHISAFASVKATTQSKQSGGTEGGRLPLFCPFCSLKSSGY